jgi:hypothetical protein
MNRVYDKKKQRHHTEASLPIADRVKKYPELWGMLLRLLMMGSHEETGRTESMLLLRTQRRSVPPQNTTFARHERICGARV